MIKKYYLYIILVFIIGSGLFVIKGILNDKDDTLSKEDLALRTIVEHTPSLLNNETPVIEVVSVSSHDDGWQVATIKSTRDLEEFVPVRVLLRPFGNKLEVIAGPEIHFTETDLLKYNVPDSVIMELQKT